MAALGGAWRRPGSAGRELIEWLESDSRARGPRALVLVAHPDDETIGIGARLAKLAPSAVALVTDGAPRDPWFAASAGCGSRAEYATLRHDELEAALLAGGVRDAQIRHLGFVDQEAALELEALVTSVEALFRELRPEVVLTHAYEGGHPDHDATAFAAQAASRRLTVSQRPVLLEMAYYHEQSEGTVWGRFAGDAGSTTRLRSDALARKRAMLACYRSQATVLARFPIELESLRLAPEYDFRERPPSGLFHYDAFGWPLAGADFLRLATAASR